MRVVLDLCDRCRAEMPSETADGGRLRIRLEVPVPKRALRRPPEAPLMELCQACRREFGAWLHEAGAIVAGLTPEPAKAPMPPVELPSADPPAPDNAADGVDEEEEEDEEAETVVLSVGGAPPAGGRPPPRRPRSK